MSESAPRVLLVTSSGAPPTTMTPVMAAVEAIGMHVRAIDVGGAGGGGPGMADRVRRALLGEAAERRLRRELASNTPDVAVTFDAHAGAALVSARDSADVAVPVVAVVSDLDPPAEWARVEADRFLVVDNAAAVSLADAGVESDRVLVAGAFGEHAFAAAAANKPDALRARFGLTGKAVLVEVAGIGAELASGVCLQLSLSAGVDGVTFLFDAGSDVESASVVRKQVPALGLRGKLFGATADAALLWRVADVVVARPRAATVAKVLLIGAPWVALVHDGDDPSWARALEARSRAMVVGNVLSLSTALETALTARRPAPTADGADGAADVIFAVGRDRRGVVDERRAADRRATHERVEATRIAADAVARASAVPGELEDLSGPSASPAAQPPRIHEVERLIAEVRARVAETSKAMMAARSASEAAAKAASTARAAGSESEAEPLERAAANERARMHSLLGEMAQLESEQRDLERARTVATHAPPSDRQDAAPPTAGRGAAPQATPSARGSSVDDALSNLKRQAAGSPGSSPRAKVGGRSAPSAAASTVDDELAQLKRKLAEARKKS